MKRRVLIVGGTRNLGPELVESLLSRGDDVTVLTRGLTTDTLPAEVFRLRADRSNAWSFAAVLFGRSFDLVFDTTLMNGEDARAAVEVLDGRVGRYVWWSTGQVYLVREGARRPFRESEYDGPVMAEPPRERASDHRNWAYGVEKRAAEEVLRRAARSRGFPAVSLRMPMIHSRRDHYGRIAGYVHRILDGGPILAPEDELPVRHVFGGDVVAASLLAAERGEPGAAFNIGQDETLGLDQMLQLIAEACGRPLRLRRLPRRSLEERNLLPGCSPFSDPWMSSLDNTLGKSALGITYTGPAAYVPPLVEYARTLDPRRLPGYGSREEELRLAGEG
jgi:nucleoside-diphosphate-sugar epimerase